MNFKACLSFIDVTFDIFKTMDKTKFHVLIKHRFLSNNYKVQTHGNGLKNEHKESTPSKKTTICPRFF